MKIYRVNVRIVGTLYIRASSKKTAQEAAVALKDSALVVASNYESEVEVSGLHLNDPNLPDISLSPAMTLCEPMDSVQAAE